MISRALFVSDLHLRSRRDPNYELFGRFLDRLAQDRPDFLFLVGDIFDLWIADRRYFARRYGAVIEKLRALKSAGVKIHYFEGNHDLDLRPFWEGKLGFKVHEGPAIFTIDKRAFRVEHGDQMDPEDRGYLFLRWLLRTPVLRFFGRHLPDFCVRWIGERASRASREYTSHVKAVADENAHDKIRDHVRRVAREYPFDVFVSGHVHVAGDFWIEVAKKRIRCLNMGTWLKQPFVLLAEGDRIQLLRVEDYLRESR